MSSKHISYKSQREILHIQRGSDEKIGKRDLKELVLKIQSDADTSQGTSEAGRGEERVLP